MNAHANPNVGGVSAKNSNQAIPNTREQFELWFKQIIKQYGSEEKAAAALYGLIVIKCETMCGMDPAQQKIMYEGHYISIIDKIDVERQKIQQDLQDIQSHDGTLKNGALPPAPGTADYKWFQSKLEDMQKASVKLKSLIGTSKGGPNCLLGLLKEYGKDPSKDTIVSTFCDKDKKGNYQFDWIEKTFGKDSNIGGTGGASIWDQLAKFLSGDNSAEKDAMTIITDAWAQQHNHDTYNASAKPGDTGSNQGSNCIGDVTSQLTANGSVLSGQTNIAQLKIQFGGQTIATLASVIKQSNQEISTQDGAFIQNYVRG